MQKEKGTLGVPLNLQFFATSGAGGGEGTPGTGEGTPGTGGGDGTSGGQQQTPQFDYQRLADIVSGKQSVTEDTVLKNYFKQQGLSQEEVNQAISVYKQQKAASQPDVNALQTQAAQAQQQAQQAIIERDAYLLAGELGVDLKTMPYVLKMADLGTVVSEDGKVAQDKLKEALNKVLEVLPQLKQQANPTTGFQIGAAGGAQTQNAVEEQLDNIFGVKKK